jgi:hypothetical protein
MRRLTSQRPRQRITKTDTLKAVFSPGFIFLVVMAGDSMLRRGEGAQAGSPRLHDQTDFGA